MTTKPKAQHTPTPWAVYHWHPEARDIAYVAPAGLDDSFFRVDEIATLYKCTPGESSGADANAEFIVHAVNSHAALVEVLERILPNIGWRSLRGDDPNLFYCEFCAESDPDWRNIPHHDECAVYAAVAALAA